MQEIIGIFGLISVMGLLVFAAFVISKPHKFQN